MRTIQYELSKTRSYVKRRRAKGTEPLADEIWRIIRSSWPGLTDEEHERIFQACDGGRDEKH